MTAQEIVEALCESTEAAEFWLKRDSEQWDRACRRRDLIKNQLADWIEVWRCKGSDCPCVSCAEWRALEEACRGKA